jgi:hypothetical protein
MVLPTLKEVDRVTRTVIMVLPQASAAAAAADTEPPDLTEQLPKAQALKDWAGVVTALLRLHSCFWVQQAAVVDMTRILAPETVGLVETAVVLSISLQIPYR